ncbi:MAG TPA: hypothetical protein VGK38_12660, partial [Prolixibacteraceae bacterium]
RDYRGNEVRLGVRCSELQGRTGKRRWGERAKELRIKEFTDILMPKACHYCSKPTKTAPGMPKA